MTEVGTAHKFQGREFPVVVFDLVEDELDERWMARARSTGTSWERAGVRLFTVAVTRTRSRLYVLGSRRRIDSAPAGTPLRAVAELLRQRRARAVAATTLVTPTSIPDDVRPLLGPFGAELADVLARHVRVTDIHDERTFFEAFEEQLAAARHSVWMWAPWTAKRVRSLVPMLADAVSRGVAVTVFIRDPSDGLQRRPDFQEHVAALRAVGVRSVQINVMHQKIVVIDERTVLLGSLNTLSQSWTREVMVAMTGAHFARTLLEHEHARVFAAPPLCGACQGDEIDLRRRTDGQWFWRCQSASCRTGRRGGTAWTADVVLTGSGRGRSGPAGGA